MYTVNFLCTKSKSNSDINAFERLSSYFVFRVFLKIITNHTNWTKLTKIQISWCIASFRIDHNWIVSSGKIFTRLSVMHNRFTTQTKNTPDGDPVLLEEKVTSFCCLDGTRAHLFSFEKCPAQGIFHKDYNFDLVMQL